ncbi:YeiH family protein [Emticicia sp. 21SJ11W-3]|uniref:YeiH family protein n=1 Tax=Emticicia sp. 21SJ11W-3 TaxID=2916755 RepID=UPI0020A21155|nr:putative sulfate exporter family transporter [Emticicia sp. 21SJ11W-3]UTA70005.1 putative sulfate exporter family transporter [Emticicia sp. 21SJ11W-3]
MPTPAKKIFFTEDSTVILLGFSIIILSILGVLLPTPSFGWQTSNDLLTKVLAYDNIVKILVLLLAVLTCAIIGALALGKPVVPLLAGIPVIFVLTMLALIIAGNNKVKNLNLEAVIFSLLIGLVIGNTVQLPLWLKKSLSTEVFVKIGLVILGTSVIFSDILQAGLLGLIQALVVVVSVWYFAFWVSKKLGIDEEMAIMLSSAVSICGVSAAIATSGAIKGDSKKLSYVISLVLITAIPMMIFMPYIAKALGLSEEVTGAWLGGTIDTTGAVVASGTLVGEVALKTSTIVKFSQNVLLGVAAFAISIYWTYTNNPLAKDNETKPSLTVIWDRFPKFVLGFLAASLLFSFFVPADTINAVKGSLKNLQGLWFALAFTSIGLETNFRDIFNKDNKKPLYAFLIAQTFNIFITLIIAYYLFR